MTCSELGRRGGLACGWSKLLMGLGGLGLFVSACAGQQTSPAAGNEPSSEASAAAPDDGLADEPEESWGEQDAQQNAQPARSGSSEKDSDEEIVETRTMEVIQEVVTKNRASVRACYDQTREKHPGLPGGDFTLTILIDPEGAVQNVEQNLERSTLRSPDLTKCAVAAVKTWKFPPSSRGMESTVNYPFNFKP